MPSRRPERRRAPLRRAACLLAAVLLPAPAWAYRPFVSTDAAVADPQEMEIELGVFTLERTKNRDTFIVPKTVLNYGLLSGVELVGEFQVPMAPGEDAQLAEPGLSLKAVLKEGVLQEKEGMGVAVEAGPLLPSTVPGARRFGYEGAGILSGRLVPITYHLNVGGGVDREAGRPFATWGVIAEVALRPDLRVVSEVNGEIHEGEVPSASGLLGLIWHAPSSNLYLDAGLRRGFTHGAPDWQVTLGLTYGLALPRR